MTLEEIVLWEYLRERPLGFKFRRQHPYGPFVLDFYCHAARLAVETAPLPLSPLGEGPSEP